VSVRRVRGSLKVVARADGFGKAALFKNLGEKLLHGFPRAFVRLFVVSRALGIVIARHGLGKGMDRARRI